VVCSALADDGTLVAASNGTHLSLYLIRHAV
jgi:hypothetical protein